MVMHWKTVRMEKRVLSKLVIPKLGPIQYSLQVVPLPHVLAGGSRPQGKSADCSPTVKRITNTNKWVVVEKVADVLCKSSSCAKIQKILMNKIWVQLWCKGSSPTVNVGIHLWWLFFDWSQIILNNWDCATLVCTVIKMSECMIYLTFASRVFVVCCLYSS